MEIRKRTPRPVIFASDCEENEDGDLVCAGCSGDYAECPCLGPHNAEDEGYVLCVENGKLVAYPDPDRPDQTD